MTRLEDLQPTAAVRGILPDQVVTVVSVQWFGSEALELTYKGPSGRVANELLYRHDEPRLQVLERGRPWSFDGDGHLFRLVSEAHRSRLAHLFDPVLAVHTSLVEPLPHQITAVYEAMLPRQPLRFLLADDPGAGKTIMAGLLIKELIARGDLQRCLVVCPGSLAEQWQDELYRRFQLSFEILTNDVSHESRQQCEHSIGQLLINCEYSPKGELAVVCKGKKGQGFKVCFDCGYAISTVERTKTSHRTPLGRDCNGPLRSPWHLGHSFQTDLLLLSVTTKEHSGMPSLRKDESFWLSFLYSLLEGASEALGIRRRDLDGCLYAKPDQYGMVLFDTVPGGAGHVRRLMDESNLRATLRASKARLEPTEAHNCGEETSCYGCLRNYDNQFCHDQLRRGPILRFLQERL